MPNRIPTIPVNTTYNILPLLNKNDLFRLGDLFVFDLKFELPLLNKNDPARLGDCVCFLNLNCLF